MTAPEPANTDPSVVGSLPVAAPANPAKKTQRNANFRSLVEKYPAHEFIIDSEEARALGFKVTEPDADIGPLFDEIGTALDKTETDAYIGLVPEPSEAA